MSSPAPRRASRLELLAQFVLIPLVIVAVGISVFVLFGLVASEERRPTDYLREIRTGHANRRWQAAFEMARDLRQRGGQVDPRVVEQVLETFEWARDEDPQIRRYLAQALGILGDPRALPALVDALQDRDADTRLWAANALGALGDRTTGDALRPLLADPDPAVRKQTAHTLAVLDVRDARDDLAGLLEDPVVDVRWNAALALAWLDDGRGRDVLTGMLDRERLARLSALRPDQAERAMVSALEAFRRLRDREVLPLVRALAEDDESLRVRQAAMTTLDALSASREAPEPASPAGDVSRP